MYRDLLDDQMSIFIQIGPNQKVLKMFTLYPPCLFLLQDSIAIGFLRGVVIPLIIPIVPQSSL